ncbi:MAG TPA: aminoacyl-tRNA hydrolase [Candidatus Dormibacteraeota bacterium]|jgi:PTH1 family peptidyl-tRNA hydrolase|nr:aminoacyl-tRNA hydrolase [Candidatus Dormibacteraeota bacterium]
MPTLVIGLGNHGGGYANTRHNTGWMALDELQRRGRFAKERKEGPARVSEGSVDGFDLVLARPQTYMNLSGRAAVHLVDRFGVAPADIIVVHDDLDLPLGRIRLRRNGSPGGQKGVKSLADSLRFKDFIRVRIGIGRPAEEEDPVDYVLRRFRPDEREVLDDVLPRAADAVIAIVRDGLDRAASQFNSAPKQGVPALGDVAGG